MSGKLPLPAKQLSCRETSSRAVDGVGGSEEALPCGPGEGVPVEAQPMGNSCPSTPGPFTRLCPLPEGDS